MDEMADADAVTIAVPAGHHHMQIGVAQLHPRRQRHRPAM